MSIGTVVRAVVYFLVVDYLIAGSFDFFYGFFTYANHIQCAVVTSRFMSDSIKIPV